MNATDVDWSSIGDDERLTKIPELLENLRSSRAQHRRFGVNKLADLVAHQGWLDPVGVPLIPFLHEVALDPSTKDRAPLLVLLADLASMGDHLHVLKDGSLLQRGFFAPGTHYRAAQDAVSARFPEYLPLLGDRSPAMRGATALLCGLMSARAEQAADALEARLAKEKPGPARGAMLVALGLLARSGRETNLDSALFERSEDPWSALGAALARAYAAADLSDAEVRTLVQMVQSPPEAHSAFPWGAGNVAQLCLDLLIDRAGRTHDAEPLRALLEQRPDSAVAAAIVKAMIPDLHDGWRLPCTLTETEREVLRLTTPCNYYTENLAKTLADRGFPAHAPSILRFIGDAPDGPLDRVVAGLPLWRWVRGAMNGSITPDELLETLDRLGDEEVVELFLDTSTLYMRLNLANPRTDGGAHMVLRSGARFLTLWSTVLRARVAPRRLRQLLVAREASPAEHRALECGALLAAYEGTRPPLERLRDLRGVLLRAIGPGVHDALRPVFARLPLGDREAVALARPPRCVQVGPYWKFHGTLPWLDLVPTRPGAELVIDACRRLQRPPLDLITDVLRSMGAVAHEPIRSALANGELPPEKRAALERALG